MSLILDHVNHIYGEDTNLPVAALVDINLVIPDGQFIGLIGHTGSGKSTLVQHLNGLLKPTSGAIYFNGQDISDKDYDKNKVEESLGHSGFGKTLKNGTETELLREFDDEGVMLSGGESQKVAIARAFYKDCPFAILDEPSANLDPVSEYSLNEAMSRAVMYKDFERHAYEDTCNLFSKEVK